MTKRGIYYLIRKGPHKVIWPKPFHQADKIARTGLHLACFQSSLTTFLVICQIISYCYRQQLSLIYVDGFSNSNTSMSQSDHYGVKQLSIKLQRLAGWGQECGGYWRVYLVQRQDKTFTSFRFLFLCVCVCVIVCEIRYLK